MAKRPKVSETIQFRETIENKALLLAIGREHGHESFTQIARAITRAVAQLALNRAAKIEALQKEIEALPPQRPAVPAVPVSNEDIAREIRSLLSVARSGRAHDRHYLRAEMLLLLDQKIRISLGDDVIRLEEFEP